MRRAQPAVAAGTLLMRSHHDAFDDSLRIVGRVTKLSMTHDGNAATFEAALLTDTTAGRDAVALTAGPLPHVGVSIVGRWLGKVRTETAPDGLLCETADDIEIVSLDLTGNPGIPQARIATEATAEARRRAGLITESAEDAVMDAPEPDVPSLDTFAGRQAMQSLLGAVYARPPQQRGRSFWDQIRCRE